MLRSMFNYEVIAKINERRREGDVDEQEGNCSFENYRHPFANVDVQTYDMCPRFDC